MKEIVVLAASGGTAKTAVATLLSILSKNRVLVDCDVEASCLTRLMKPVIGEKKTLTNSQVAVIDEESCNQCGECERACRFGAIQDVINNCQISATSCVGCGFCYNVCPEEAITMQENVTGNVYSSQTEYGHLLHTELAVMQENSGQLISLVRQKAKQIARKENLKWIICDGPPGLGSPVFSALFETSLAVLVVEPTQSGISDLERLLTACQKFKVPAVVCLNQFDINVDNTRAIEDYCRGHGIRIASRIPFDDGFMGSINRGLPNPVEASVVRSPEMTALWDCVTDILGNP